MRLLSGGSLPPRLAAPRSSVALLLGAALALPACAPLDPELARRAWLVEQLTRENEVFLGRDPALLASKYAAMAAHPFDWMRGSHGLWLQDQLRPAGERVPTAFADDPIADPLLLVGDPHPENLGTFLPGPGPGPTVGDPPDASAALRLEFNDLDGAAFGPWILDLRRAAFGLALLLHGLAETDDPALRDAAVDALASAWLEGVQGEPPVYTLGEDALGAGLLIGDLLDEADEEGRERKRLDKYSQVGEDGRRRLRLDPALDEDGAGLLALTVEEEAQVARLLGAPLAEGGLRLLDAARRYGVGVASRPAVRYLLLVDQGQESDDDDDLLNLREVLDPPLPAGLQGTVPALFDDAPSRVEEAPRRGWSVSDADAALRGLADGAQTFKLTSASSFFQGIERAKIEEAWAEGEADRDDLLGLARVLGHTLAGAHTRAPTAAGQPSAPGLRAQLEGREEALRDELLRSAEADLARALLDRELLAEALALYGPLLGAERQSAGVGP